MELMGEDLPCYSNKIYQLLSGNVHIIINLQTKRISVAAE